MDGAQAPAPKTDAPASETDTNCEETAVAAAGPAAPSEGEPARNACGAIKSPSRGAAGRTKYQQNQARRKELKAEALADCNARGVGGAENVSLAWFERLEANSLLTPSQKTLYNSLRANAQHSAPPRITPLETIQNNVDTVHKKELEAARVQLEAIKIPAPQGTAAKSSGASEREEIRKELAEVRKLLAADAARRKKKEAVVAKTAAAAAAPPPPKPPAAETRVYQLPSFMSTSTW